MVYVNFYEYSGDKAFVEKLEAQIRDRFYSDYPEYKTEFTFLQYDEEFSLIFELPQFDSIDDVDTFLCEEICHEMEVYCQIYNSTRKKSFYYDEEEEWILGLKQEQEQEKMKAEEIQFEVQKIHSQFGTTEMANYKIQKLFEDYVKSRANPIYVVISRNSGFIGVFKEKNDATEAMNNQEYSERMAGGSPSVYITESEVK